jgi:hypothetical protein
MLIQAEFEYIVEAEYDTHGDVVRDDLKLTINYTRYDGTYEITDVFKRRAEGGFVRVEEDELVALIGPRAYDILEDAAHDDWLEYGSDR